MTTSKSFLGYGKDAAGIAMEAIKFARDSKIDVCLIDTAGRMQVIYYSLSRLLAIYSLFKL